MKKMLIAATLVIACPLASASTFARASHGAFSFTLSDIDPGNGLGAVFDMGGSVIGGSSFCGASNQGVAQGSSGWSLPGVGQYCSTTTRYRSNIVMSGGTAVTITLDAYVWGSGPGLKGAGVSIGVGDLTDELVYSLREGSFEEARTLSVTFANTGASATAFTLDWSIYEEAVLGAAPVPEPETWALLLAGLGVVGWHVRSARDRSLHAGPEEGTARST